MIILPESRVERTCESNWRELLGKKRAKNRREREKIKGVRMIVTQKGTRSICNVLIILDFMFQLLHFTDKKRKLRVCVIP